MEREEDMTGRAELDKRDSDGWTRREKEIEIVTRNLRENEGMDETYRYG